MSSDESQPHYVIRRMERSEVDMALEWAAREGWNPGLHDAECFWAVDEEGWWIGLLDDVAICLKSAVAYDAHFGFMGFYITHPDYRGQGYGLQLWNKANDSLKPRNVGMDGVLAQQENYAKSGYRFAYRQLRYCGIGPEVNSLPLQKLKDLKDIEFQALLDFDRQHFPAERKKFLELWITRPRTVALGYVENEQLRGYGVLRPCRKGFKIGPLFAENVEIAELLYRGLCSEKPAQEAVTLDIPEPNADALALVEKYDMQFEFETARMYTQDPPEIKLSQIYGVTSFELG